MSWNDNSMLEPRRSRTPVLAGAFRVIAALFVLAVAASLVFSLFGWAFHILFFLGRLAIIAGLVVIGVRLLVRSRR
jgi:hypothetical protein